MSTETIIAIAGIAFLAALCQSITAFGFALVMVPLLALVWDVKPAIVTSTLLSTTFMIPLLYGVRAGVRPRAVAPMLAGSLVGIPPGILVLARIDADILQVLVALTVAAACVTMFASMPTMPPPRSQAVTAFFAGGVSGALRGATSMSGPPIVLFALRSYGHDVEGFRANVLAVLLPSSLVTIAGLVLAGLVDSEVAIACVIAAPTMVAGSLAGATLRGRVSSSVFRTIVLSVLIASSAVVLMSALASSV